MTDHAPQAATDTLDRAKVERLRRRGLRLAQFTVDNDDDVKGLG